MLSSGRIMEEEKEHGVEEVFYHHPRWCYSGNEQCSVNLQRRRLVQEHLRGVVPGESPCK